MSGSSACPANRDLLRHVLGQLSGREAEQMKEHIARCSQCQESVRGLGVEGTQFHAALAVEETAQHAPLPSLTKPPPAVKPSPAQTKLPPAAKPQETHDPAMALEETMMVTPAAAPAPARAPAATRSVDPSVPLAALLRPPEADGEVGRLGGRYRILKMLGSGATGVVFHAEDLQLRRAVALKVMKPVERGQDEAKVRFLREGRLAASIEHDHIMAIYDVGEDNGTPYIAMKLLQGETLDDCLKKTKQLDIYEVLRISHEIAQGLAAAHEQGLIHRDIKPANIWLEARTGRVKLVDFGLARAQGDDVQLTKTGTVMGTPAYMAPEQSRGEKVDHRCDLYSLGSVIYRMVTGRTPFIAEDTMGMLLALAHEQPPPMKAFREDVPEMLQGLVLMLLAKHPDTRPQSADEVVEAIERIAEQLSGEGEQEEEAPPPAGSPVVTMVAMLLLAGLAFAAFWFWPQLQEWRRGSR